MAKEIVTFALSPLTNNAHFAFVKLTLEHANENDAVKTNAAKALAALTAAYNDEDAAIKLATKNAMSDDIASYDSVRDKTYTGYKSIVNGYTYMNSSELSTAAKTLNQHIKTNKVNVRSQLDTESSALYNFIQDLDSTYAEQVKTLGLTAVVAEMKTANDKVLEILANRDADNATRVAGAVKAARTATDAAYATFVKTVNALAIINGDTDYATFIDTMNEQIARYKRQLLGQSTTTDSSTSGDNTTSSDTGDNSGSSSSDDGGSSSSGGATDDSGLNND